MENQLKTHPFQKTFNETSRSINRMNNYLDVFFEELSDDDKERIHKVIEGLEKALNNIPEEHRLTRHEQLKRKKGKFW